ncbi:dicarboxylate/amino acid:cation symporter [Spirochaetota bacterium]
MIRIICSPFFALIISIALGIIFPKGASYVSWAGTIFISLLKVMVLPIIFISCFHALSKNPLKETARLGKRTLLYYLLTSALAAAVGISFAFIFIGGTANPGGLPQVGSITPSFNVNMFIEKFIPSNIFDSLANGNILHIVLFALFAGLVVQFIPGKQKLTDIAESLNELLIKMLGLIIKATPIGIIGLVYPAVAKLSVDSIFTLGSFSLSVLLATAIHSMITLPLILYLASGRNPVSFFFSVRNALMVALSTASSSATYPVSKEVLEKNEGVSEDITGFSLPIGATLNMDGSAVYQSILLVFMTYLAGATLAPWQVVLIFVLTMLSSAGTAGIPGGGIAMMAFMLDLLGLPTAYLGLYLLVDKFFDYPVTAINVWGDLIIARVLHGKGSS